MTIDILKPDEMPAPARVNTSDDPDAVEVIELGIDADEQELGVVEGRLFLWQRVATVILKTVDGLYVAGNCAPRPGRIYDRAFVKSRARSNALKLLPTLRERFGMPPIGPRP